MKSHGFSRFFSTPPGAVGAPMTCHTPPEPRTRPDAVEPHRNPPLCSQDERAENVTLTPEEIRHWALTGEWPSRCPLLKP
jgi:hypothetical protein